ncbi:MAG: DUF1361 domain-containing protein [Spirochaetales bacterium]|nr:DUF1361 domain-containing protein [Spirochaetales bacterium]
MDGNVSLRPWIPLTLALAVASCGCLLMIVLRVAVTGSIRYTFLLWNLFLAWIPYFLALAVRRIAVGRPLAADTPVAAGIAVGIKPLAVVLALAWLFFYPNAPYILTDFIHVIRNPVEVQPPLPLITENALLWYDIILNSAFAFIGHIIGLISLLILHRTIRRRWNRRLGWGFAVVATGLGGYGIYLGRFERLNSWDIAREPVRTLGIAFANLVNLKAVAVSLAFALFIFLTYLAVYYLYETARKSRA